MNKESETAVVVDTNKAQRQVLPGTPSIFYIDQMVAMGIGPFVSKITFAHETDDGLVPNMTLVMPTNVLQLLGNQINAALHDQALQKALSDEHGAFGSSLKTNS